jgi:hypothetical protein
MGGQGTEDLKPQAFALSESIERLLRIVLADDGGIIRRGSSDLSEKYRRCRQS